MAAWMILALAISADLTAASRTSFNHVRSEEQRVRELIAQGYARSATFKSLIDAVEASPCIVYIATVRRLAGGMTGALLHVSAGRREEPVLRIVLKGNLSDEEAIGTIGHELQHVREAMATLPAGGGIDFSAAFDPLDPMAARATGVRQYETLQAVRVTRQVRDELRQSGARRSAR